MKKLKQAWRVCKLVIVLLFVAVSVGFCGGLPYSQSNRKNEKTEVKIEWVEKSEEVLDFEIKQE